MKWNEPAPKERDAGERSERQPAQVTGKPSPA